MKSDWECIRRSIKTMFFILSLSYLFESFQQNGPFGYKRYADESKSDGRKSEASHKCHKESKSPNKHHVDIKNHFKV